MAPDMNRTLLIDRIPPTLANGVQLALGRITVSRKAAGHRLGEHKSLIGGLVIVKLL